MSPLAERAAPAREDWDRIADGFDRFATPIQFPLAARALRLVGLRPGMRFLDIAAACGGLGIPAARGGAQVLAIDFAPGMIQRLNARAREEGLRNLEGRVMDGLALDLADDAFDIAASVNGVSLFPDPGRGVREMVRVTRPGGRALIVAFGPVRKAELLSFFLAAAQACAPGFEPPPLDPPFLPFQLADPLALRRLMTDAGLTDVRVETATWPMKFQSALHFWNTVASSNPVIAAMVADMAPRHVTDTQRVIEGMLRERSGGAPGAVLHAEVNIGCGTR